MVRSGCPCCRCRRRSDEVRSLELQANPDNFLPRLTVLRFAEVHVNPRFSAGAALSDMLLAAGVVTG